MGEESARSNGESLELGGKFDLRNENPEIQSKYNFHL